jgi:hypothetical protein
MRKRAFIAALAVIHAVVAVTLVGAAFGSSQSEIAALRNATAAFHDIETAVDAGYTVELPDVFGETCIANLSNPSAGAMGVHMVSLARVADPSLDETDPEVLVYERRNNGSLKLVAVEYVVFASADSSTPTLFGVPFEFSDGSRYGLPPFYAPTPGSGSPTPASLRESSAAGTRA